MAESNLQAAATTSPSREGVVARPAAMGVAERRATVAEHARARLALCVGVTGHRPNRLVGADLALLRQRVREVLEFVRDAAAEAGAAAGSAYAPGPPLLRVISPLAEGADRIVAEEAVALGFELQSPLPFMRDDYEQDFATSESRESYRRLLARATAVLELDGKRDTPTLQNEAYEAVGRVVLNHCDVLIAIWDGKEAQGSGGTAQIVREASMLGIPIAWIHSQPPHKECLITQDSRGAPREIERQQLRERLIEILLPPRDTDPEEGARALPDLRETFFAERQPRWAPLGWLWRVFRDLVADFRLRLPVLTVDDFDESTRREWNSEWAVSPGLPRSVVGFIDSWVRHQYARADKLANYYANTYRSSFVANYLLGVVAVFLTVLAYGFTLTGTAPESGAQPSGPEHAVSTLKLAAPQEPTHGPAGGAVGEHEPVAPAGQHEPPAPSGGHNRTGEEFEQLFLFRHLGEIVVVLTILALILLANKRRWHERWLDYRFLAELLRQLRFLALLGRVPKFSRLPAHIAYGDPRGTWMAWHLRAVAREMGMVSARFTPEYLEACRVLLRDALIGESPRGSRPGPRRYYGQLLYHLDNARRFERLNRRLRMAGLLTFVCTLASAVTLTVLHLLHVPVGTWWLFVVPVFPALGTALGGIRSQAELERVVRRSDAMSEQLERVREELERPGPLTSTELGRVTESASDAMVAEVLDWRIVFETKPLELPG